MKPLSILFIVLLSACQTATPTVTGNTENPNGEQETFNTIKKIVFNTSTRGFSKTITITKDSVHLLVNSSFEGTPSQDTKTALTAEEWTKIVNALQGVTIQELDKLESPTMMRAVDAADHSSLAIVADKESIHAFDNYHPHETLKGLMEIVLEIEKDRVPSKH